ncbi:hypothetical protein Halha_0579 [Halobacteroides halobius DSM 5150]|uniref:2-phosphosulfolactate phosphatase n=1 Tax=Halobacteroides halobius (strain ATCC 35273 / DSM 5150 / MD-1) TaxID=748449 RepID=L0K8V6_HALHC|nr:hypothetical protein [Halobacteroides halobius]AGB40553.1 hypothetical protein Halha_0579 [Halobacteroides halobius DSM 5150]
MEHKIGNNDHIKTLNITSNASGAVRAARDGNVVVIVDIIDMSTSAEAALDAGAVDIFAASPDNILAPVKVNPEKIGYFAGKTALKHSSELLIVTEPRLEDKEEQRKNIQQALSGVRRAGVDVLDIIPNLGTEVVKLADFSEKVVLLVTQTGGVAFDAAYNYGAPAVTTGTVVRTLAKKGIKPAQESAARAVRLALKYNTGITLVAASSNSYEDILAAEQIAKMIINTGFLSSDGNILSDY